MTMTPASQMGNIVLDAWSRSIDSYSNSLGEYKLRVQDGLQPVTQYFNVFSVDQQNNFLCYANALYLVITILLYTLMKRRSNGFRLRWILVLYDGSNVILASYIAITILRYKLTHGSKLVCNELANDLEGYQLSWVFALFYLQKYYEFLDTWFFILRKSSRQVTFLHLFHHSSITVVVGSILPFDYNADMYLPIFLNSANHTLLYLHYLLATLGLKSWWAPYITSMQLLQFCIIFAQSLVSYVIGPRCGSPDFAKVLMIVYMGSMIALFINFFLQKYVLRRPVQTLDMCGVVKRPSPMYSNVPSQYCGTAVLDHTGSCIVTLPEDFPDEERVVRETMRPAPFCIVYSLTAMGSAMPSLYVAREVGRISVLAPGTPVLPHAAGRATPVKLSPNSATALTGSRDKKRRPSGGNHPKPLSGSTPEINSGSRDHGTLGSPVEALPVKKVPIPSSSAPLRREPFGLLDVPQFSNANVVKSASISDFRLLPSQDSLADSRNSSSGNLQLLHNDRLIDGPLPLSESFELINRYSQQIRTGISESIFRLTLGALAAEERGGREDTQDSAEVMANTSAGGVAVQAAEQEDSATICCGALSAEDRVGNFAIRTSSADSDQSPSGGAFSVPLTFVIAGGVPGGKVSWVVHTAPIVTSTVQAGDTKMLPGDGDAAGLSQSAGAGAGATAGQRARPPYSQLAVSTGVISSTPVSSASALVGNSRGGSSNALSTMEEVAQQQRGEYAEDYALDWRAIS